MPIRISLPLLVTATGPGPAGSRRVNVEPSPSRGLDPDLAPVVAGDVADDGEAEAGAAGLAAAGPVDPVEALEDPLEVAARDADAVVAHLDVDPACRRCGPAPATVDAGLGVLHRVVEQVVDAPRRAGGGRPTTASRGGGSSTSIVDALLLGGGPHPVDGLGDERGAPARRRAGPPRRPRCGDSSSRSSMVRPTRNASLSHPLGQPAGRPSGSSSSSSVSASSASAPTGRLELVADVGHEVAADGLEPAPLGRVLDHDQHARTAAPGRAERHRPDAEDAAGRAEQLELALGAAAPQGVGGHAA